MWSWLAKMVQLVYATKPMISGQFISVSVLRIWDMCTFESLAVKFLESQEQQLYEMEINFDCFYKNLEEY